MLESGSPASPSVDESRSSGFGTSFKRGLQQTIPQDQELLGAAGIAAGQLIDSPKLTRYGASLYRYGKKQGEPLAGPSLEDVFKGKAKFGDWAGSTLGNLSGQALQSAITALGGAAIGGTVGSGVPGAGNVAGAITGGAAGLVGKKALLHEARQLAERYVENQLAKGVSKDVAEAGAAKLIRDAGTAEARKLGGVLGATGLNSALETGQAVENRLDQGVNPQDISRGQAAQAVGAGIVAGSIDTAAEAINLGRFLHASPKGGSVLRRVAREALGGAAREGSTEVAQSYLERVGGGAPTTGPDAWRDYFESGAAGALGGGVFDAPAGVLHRTSHTQDHAGEPVVERFPGAAPGSISDVANQIDPLAEAASKTAAEGAKVTGTVAGPDNQAGETTRPAANSVKAEKPALVEPLPAAWIDQDTGEAHAPHPGQLVRQLAHQIDAQWRAHRSTRINVPELAKAWGVSESEIKKARRPASRMMGEALQANRPLEPATRNFDEMQADLQSSPDTATAATKAEQSQAVAAGTEQSAAPEGATLQNRDRSRAASVVQMQEIAKNPDPTRLSFSRDANSGAPMVASKTPDEAVPAEDRGKTDQVRLADGRSIPVQYAVVDANTVAASHHADGTVNSDYANAPLQALNNGRTAGIQAAWKRGNGKDYKQGLIDDTQMLGISPSAIQSKERPMVVRLYDAKHNQGDMGAASNASTSLGLSPTEQAQTDARALPDLADLPLTADGGISTNMSATFHRKFLNALGPAERGQLVTADGAANKAYFDRLRAAIFAKAYGDPKLIAAQAEETNPDARNALNALVIAAPTWAKIDPKGPMGDYAQRFAAAMNVIHQAHNNGQKVGKLLAQGDLVGRDTSGDAWAEFFAANARSAKRMAEGLRYAGEIVQRHQQHASNDDMFGAPKLAAADVIDMVRRDQEKRYGSEESAPKQAGTLFNAAGKPSEPRARQGHDAGRGVGGEQARRAGTQAGSAGGEKAREVAKPPIPEKTPTPAPAPEEAKTQSSENAAPQSAGQSFKITQKGPKGLVVHGDPAAIRAALSKAGFKKKGRALKAGGLRFDAKDHAAIEKALNPAQPSPKAQAAHARYQEQQKNPSQASQELSARAEALRPKVQALSDEQARIALKAIGETKPAQLRDPQSVLMQQHPDDIEQGLKAVPETEIKAPAKENAKPADTAAKVESAAKEAASSPNNEAPEPTDAQKDAGNYKKGHVSVQGLDISIENPRGSTRSGVSEDGKAWSNTMSDHYGYVKRTVGADNEQVDVYVGPNPDSDRVYVVDQIDQKTGKFDEHKAMIGFDSEKQAIAAYLSNFDKGWKVGPVNDMSMAEFKDWLHNGDTSNPVSERAPDASAADPSAQTELERHEIPKYNPMRPADKVTTDLYRETNAHGAVELMEGMRRSSGPGLNEKFAASTRDLALGQGQNRGVMLHLDPAGFDARLNLSMPTARRMIETSGQAELLILPREGENSGDFVRSVMLKKGWKEGNSKGDTNRLLYALKRRQAQDGWTRAETPDGIMYSRPSEKYEKSLDNATAPEHVHVGADDRELGQIVQEFNQAQKSMMEDGQAVTNIFKPPAKSEIERLDKKAKVYTDEHGWMSVKEAKQKIAKWRAHAAAQGADTEIRNENSQKIVLSLFDLTGQWSKPWEEAGYQVYRFDIQDTGTFTDANGKERKVGDIHNFSVDFFNELFGSFDGLDVHAILAACPCTDFAVSGARHFAAKDADGRTVSSVKLVHQTLRTIEYFKPAVWAIENPVGRIEKLGGLPPWRLSFNPNDLGDPYTKKTLLWGRFNADLPIAPVEPTEGSKMHQKYGGKSQATKNARSVTPEGFAYSFFMANNAHDNMAMTLANKYDRLDSSLIERAVDAGVSAQQIAAAVDDLYYMHMDDKAANKAINALIPAGNNKAAPQQTVKDPGTDKTATEKGEKIEDFGQTLHGARKHYGTEYVDALKRAGEADIAETPLSESWPAPKYEKLLENGVDPEVVSFVHAIRDEIPRKPRGWKLRGWVDSVKLLRGFAQDLLSGDVSWERVREEMSKPEREVLNRGIRGRMELYQEIGHDISLQGVTFQQNHYALFRGEENVSKWSIEKKGRSNVFGNWPNQMAVGNTREEALAEFKKKLPELKQKKQKAKRQPPLIIYARPGKLGYFIGLKIPRDAIDMEHFDDADKSVALKKARAYLNENREALIERVAKMREKPAVRRAENETRIGIDHRDGADVTPQQFSDTFGFRGVQFGNYVEYARRQQDLNNAYDALMDMAGVLEIPPAALSLNGELGLAFGARGKGGKNPAAAHFESRAVVINLTKHGGPGSLAHEWWHALDNHFQKRRTDRRSPDGFMTESGRQSVPGVRDELTRAFVRIKNTIAESDVRRRSERLDKIKSKKYWSTGREMSARAFESYVIGKLKDQNAANDYLANVVSGEAFDRNGDYPYPTADEIPAIRAAYDEFFNTIDSEKTPEGNVKLFSLSRDNLSGVDAEARNARAAHARKVQDVVAQQTRAWGNQQPKVHVVDDGEALPGSAKTDPRYKGAKGFYDGRTLYLVASNLFDKADVQRTLAHEAVGHYGVDRIIDDELGAGAWDRVATSVQGMRDRVLQKQEQNAAAGKDINRGLSRIESVIAEVQRRYGSSTGSSEFAAETLAVLAEWGVRNAWLDRAISAIHKFIRKIMPSWKVGRAELEQLLVRSNQYLRARDSYHTRVSRIQAMTFSRDVRASGFPDATTTLPAGGASYGKLSKVRQSGVSESTAPSGRRAGSPVPGQLDLFAQSGNPESEAATRRGALELTQHVKQVATGQFRSGIKRITRWEDAAHIIAPLRKSPQEQFLAVVADADGRPLAVLRHTIGIADGATVNPGLVFGSVAEIPGATDVWFAHNHPSGNVDQSRADKNITDTLIDLMKGSGITAHGMITVAPGETDASFYQEGGAVGGFRSKITTAARTGTVPRLERRYRRITKQFGAFKITSPEDAPQIARKFKEPGVILLNNRHNVIGFMPVSMSEMAKLRTGRTDSGSARIASILTQANASAGIIMADKLEPAQNLGRLINDMGIRALDVFTPEDGKTTSTTKFFNSAAARGQQTMAGHFYSFQEPSEAQQVGVATAPVGSDTYKRAQAAVDKVTEKWRGDMPKVHVLESARQLPADAKTDPRWRSAEGFYDGRTIYLVAPNLKSSERVHQVLAHEAIGHYGIDRIVDDALGAGAWDKIAQSIQDLREQGKGSKAMRDVLAEVSRRYGDVDPGTFAEETLAVMAEKGVRNGIMDRVVAAVHAFVRRFMPSLKLSEDELRQLLVRSERFLQTGDTIDSRPVAGGGAISFAQAEPTSSPAFRKFFDGSKVTTPDGQPKMVYHGTSEGFYTFDDASLGNNTGHMTAPLGHFFAEKRSSAQRYAETASQGVPADERVIDAYLSIKKPKSMTLDELMAIDSQKEARALRDKLQSQGYDGIHIPEARQWVAFKANQIKSATENRGTFDSNNPDIRFSLPDQTRSKGIPDEASDPIALWRNMQPLKRNPHYAAAKAGDMQAAVDLVTEVAAPLAKQAEKFGSDAIFVAPHAEEATGKNAIPRTLAAYLAEHTGGTDDTEIVQTNRTLHTGANAMERMIARSTFSGPVKEGGRYVLVDDVTTMGGTLADLASYIQANGGEVVGTAVLTNASRSGTLRADAKLKQQIEGRYGDEIRNQFHVDPAALTADEARYLIGFRSAGELRNRAAAAARSRSERIRAKGLRKEAPQDILSTTTETPPNGGVSGSGRRNFSLPDASVNTMSSVLETPDQSAWERAKGWLTGKWEDIKPATLGALQLRHVLELAEEHPALKGARQYADINQRMDADRNQLMTGSPDASEHPNSMLMKGVAPIADQWRGWAFHKGIKGMRGGLTEHAKRLNKLMHDATILGLDPSEEYTRLSMEDSRGELSEWTPEKIKDRIRALRGQMRGRPGDDKTLMMDEVKRLRAIPAREKLREKRWPTLVARWNALPESARETYRQVRNWYREHADATERALLERIDAMDVPETYRRSMKDRIRFQFESNRREGVYFPLDRNGDYWLSATDSNNQYAFKMFESAAELKAAESKLRKAGFTIEATGRRDSSARAKDAPSGTFVKDIIGMLQKARVSEKVQDDIYQMFLKSLPEMSMRKRSIHRRSVPGFSDDALRAFAKNGFHGAHQLARLRYSQQMSTVLEAMQISLDNYRRSSEFGESTKAEGLSAAKGDALLTELKRRHDWIMSPKDSQLANMATSIGFMYYLGASPASALVNLTQGAQVTLPVLAAKHGWGKASRELGRATAAALRTGGNIMRTLNEEEKRAYKVLERRGDIDRTNAHTLAGTAEGNVLTSNPGWAKVMNVMSWMFHKAEVVNREAAGVAAFRLARADGKSFDEAVRHASDTINGTHFDYSNANRPRFMQNGVSKVLLQFKNYSVGMTWLMYRNLYQAVRGQSPEVRRLARRTLTGMLGMTALLAGTVGLPLFNLMKMVANAAHAAAGDDDEPWDFETEFRQWLAEHFGQTGADVIADGAVDRLGLHISSRVSLSNLWFRDADRQLEGKDAYYNMLESIAGPMGGMVKNWFIGQQYITQGHIWRGVERMIPTAAKSGMKALRYAAHGVNTLRGDPILEDPSAENALVQALGFTPTNLADQYRINSALYNYSDQIKNRRTSLMNAFAMAVHEHDDQARQVALKKIRSFNAKNPAIAITTKTLVQSLRQRARLSAQAEHGVVLSQRVRQMAQREAGISVVH